MRRTSNPRPYFLIPVKASTEKGFRRWNQVLISILAMLVLGLLLCGHCSASREHVICCE